MVFKHSEDELHGPPVVALTWLFGHTSFVIKGSKLGDARRAQIALLPFWALFWVKNPFCNRDFLKVPFLSQKIHLFALFWGIMTLFFNKISILSTFTMIFSWKSSLSIAFLLIFRCYAPVWSHIPHYLSGPTTFCLIVVISILRDGLGICIGHVFVASDLPFWPV